MAAKARAKRGAIAPDKLYPLEVFKQLSGIDSTRIWRARKRGVRLETVDVGRRKYVLGEAGIRYILELAALTEADELGAAQ